MKTNIKEMTEAEVLALGQKEIEDYGEALRLIKKILERMGAKQ